MTTELKDAISTIAEYDKGWKDVSITICDVLEYTNEYGQAMIYRIGDKFYHTSADALLPVWRKLGKTKLMTNDKRSLQTSYVVVGDCILDGNYPEACIKLAEIINQLNQQK